MVARKYRQFIESILILTLLFFTSSLAWATVSFSRVGAWGGACNAIAASGSRAYAGIGRNLVILDTSNPVSPSRLGCLELPQKAVSIAVSGNFAYVVTPQSGLQIVDVSDPENPSIVGSWNNGLTMSDVAVSGNYAYVTDWSEVNILNISNPANPTKVGKYSAYGGSTYCVAVSGNFVYMGDSSSLAVIDVSNPASPTRTALVNGLKATDIAISGNRLYESNSTSTGFRIFDISNPASVTSVGMCDTPDDAQSVVVAGNYAYVADSTYGLQVISTTDPAHPQIVATFDTLDSAIDMAMSNGYLFIADGADGLLAINVSDPLHPTKVGAYDSGLVRSFALSGNNIYATCYENSSNNAFALHYLNAIDPAKIARQGGCSIPGTGRIITSGSRLYIAGGLTGLHSVDISSASNPAFSNTYKTGISNDPCNSAATYGNYIVTAWDSGVNIIDPANMAVVGSLANSKYEWQYDMKVIGSTAYVSDSLNGLVILNVADPTKPDLIGRNSTSMYAYGVDVSGNYAYLAANSKGIQVMDISNPANPVKLGSWNIAGSSHGVSVSGSYAFTSISYDGVAVYDVSAPSNPILIGRYPDTNVSSCIKAVGDLVYMIDGDSTLNVLRVEQDPRCILYGFVLDTLGNPVSDVNVTISPGNYTVKTDIYGRYLKDYIEPGEYSISASKYSWATVTTTASLNSGQMVQAPVMSMQLGACIGCVKDDLGQPISGVTVTLNTSDTSMDTITATTDATGRYQFTDVLPKIYIIAASHPNYTDSSRYIQTYGGQTVTGDFILNRTGTVKGTVKDNLGRPISDVTVYISGTTADTTDASGEYVLSKVMPGTYVVTANKYGWTDANVNNVSVSVFGTTTCNITMQLAAISGTVKDSKGNLVSGVTVSASSAYGVGGPYSAVTGANGTYTLANVNPGSYDVSASKSGYVAKSNHVNTTGGQTTTSDFQLPICGYISGIVTNSSGRPLSGATLNISYECKSYTVNTGDDGRYCITDLSPFTVTHDLNVTKQGYAMAKKTITISDGQSLTCNFHMADVISVDTVSSLNLGTGPVGLAVAGNLAAIASSANGLLLIDVTNPTKPTQIGAYDTAGSANAVALSGNYACIADGNDGLIIINVSNPSAPQLAGSYDTTGDARAVIVIGSYAYVADGPSGLQIIDVSTPSNPVRVGGYDTTGYAMEVDIAGSYAYVADGSGGLQVINISNPANPVRAGNYVMTMRCSFGDVKVSGSYAYVTDSYADLFLVIDISNPSNPVAVGSGVINYESPMKVAVSGNYAYIAAGYGSGVAVMDISDPTAPGLIGKSGGFCGNDVAVAGDYIYAVDSYGKIVVLSTGKPSIKEITPNTALNLSIVQITNLSGLGFKDGISVKLTRTGQPDIVGTSVNVLNPAQIACSFDVTNANPGFWNVVTTNPDGKSATLTNGFAITVPTTARCFGISNRCINDVAVRAACSHWRFRLWGKVKSTASGSFVIDDGSGMPVKISVIGYFNLHVGDFVSVTGTLDVESDPKVLLVSANSIYKF